MRISPLDIQQKQFPIKFRGFDVEEVYAFLEILREEMEELIRENTSLKEQIRLIENQLKEHKSMETTLKETLITAQQMIEAYKNNARKEAELITREAELQADELVKNAHQKVVKIHEDIVDLRGIRRHYKEEIKRLSERVIREIEFDKEREGEAAMDENRKDPKIEQY